MLVPLASAMAARVSASPRWARMYSSARRTWRGAGNGGAALHRAAWLCGCSVSSRSITISSSGPSRVGAEGAPDWLATRRSSASQRSCRALSWRMAGWNCIGPRRGRS
ncbi:hypothetical protein D3C78_1274250 [compost metagenome]